MKADWIPNPGDSDEMPPAIKGKKFEVLTRGGKVIDSSFYDGSRGWVYTSWRKTGHCPSDIMAYRVFLEQQ